MLNKLLEHFGLYYCDYCRKIHLKKDIKRRRFCTLYANEEQNWITSCKEQFEEYNSNYQDMWDEYYSSRY
jgi:hypothetical protein